MTRELPHAGNGVPGNRRLVRTAAITLLASTLAISLGVAPALADDLNDQRDRVNSQLSASEQHLTESSAALNNAAAALADSQSQLDAARSQLAQTKADLAAANQLDQEMATKLAAAQDELEKAKAAVEEGQRNVDAKQAEVGTVVRTSYQQKTDLMSVGMFVSGESAGSMNNRVQWSTTMFDSTQAEMDRLKELQARLDAAKEHQASLERQAAADRQAAAQNLQRSKNLQAAAQQQEANVAALVQKNQDAQVAAEQQVQSDEQQVSGLQAERASVEQRIADRIAAQRAEAARQAEADRRAREAAAAKARSDAAAKQRANQRAAAASRPAAKAVAKAAPAAAPAPAAAAPRNVTASSSSAHHGFVYPSSAAITSAYGMRLHPVLKYWKLHDGTDFGAACGSPIVAAYDGVVSEKYYNGGYGNRLMIDHGRVDGRYVTTGYNHAISYNVSKGQRVKKGQVIGRVGSTGYSTGCHMHLMLWLDGGLSNPMSWY